MSSESTAAEDTHACAHTDTYIAHTHTHTHDCMHARLHICYVVLYLADYIFYAVIILLLEMHNILVAKLADF